MNIGDFVNFWLDSGLLFILRMRRCSLLKITLCVTFCKSKSCLMSVMMSPVMIFRMMSPG